MAGHTQSKPATFSGRRAALLLGDSIAFVAFATIGRMSHAEGLVASEVLRTAAPFIAGWLAVAPLAGSYNAEATATVRGMAGRTALGLLLGLPVAFGLRALLEQRDIPLGFLIFGSFASAVLVLGWRCLFTLLSRQRSG